MQIRAELLVLAGYAFFPIDFRPKEFATYEVVNVPENGSSTTSGQTHVKNLFAKISENVKF